MSLKKTTLFALLLTLSLTGAAIAAGTTFEIDKAHSGVTFSVRHLLTQVTGKFDDYAGSIVYDPANPAAGSVELTIQAKSIDTGVEKRDGHLRSPDFFDVEKFPTLSFKSEKVAAKGKDEIEVTGPLTIHGVTKSVTVPVKLLGTMDAFGGKRAGFQASFIVSRKDFGITWNKTLDAGALLLGDDVAVTINIEAATAPPAKK